MASLFFEACGRRAQGTNYSSGSHRLPLHLPQPPCLGASSRAEADDTLLLSPERRSHEGSTSAPSAAVSD